MSCTLFIFSSLSSPFFLSYSLSAFIVYSTSVGQGIYSTPRFCLVSLPLPVIRITLSAPISLIAVEIATPRSSIILYLPFCDSTNAATSFEIFSSGSSPGSSSVIYVISAYIPAISPKSLRRISALLPGQPNTIATFLPGYSWRTDLKRFSKLILL